MELHRIESNLSRDERVKLNENFDTINNEFSDVNAKISSLATGEDLSDLQAEIQNLSYVGEWDANTYYHKHNAVTVNGSSYRALVDNNGVYVSNTDTWVLVAQKGDPFTYEDFTSNQLESLRGPKGDTGTAIDDRLDQFIIDVTPISSSANRLTNGITGISTVDNYTVQYTTSSNFGHVGLTIPSNQTKKYLAVIKIKNVGTNNLGGAQLTLGYSNNTSTVQQNGTTVLSIGNIDVGTTYENLVQFTTNGASYSNAILGFFTSTNGANIQLTQRIYDITNLTARDIEEVDWFNIVEKRILKATYSEKAISTSDRIDDFIMDVTPITSSAMRLWNGTSSITVIDSNTVEYTTTTSYGHVGFTIPNNPAKKYLTVIKITNIGTINATNVRLTLAYSNTTLGGLAANGDTLFNIGSIAANTSHEGVYQFSTGTNTTYTNAILGALIFTNGANIRLTQKVYDITEMTTEEINLINWSTIKNNTVLKTSIAEKAITANSIINKGSTWQGKTWLTIGDSITAPGTYQTLVKNALGFTTVLNKGVAGQGMSTMLDNVTNAELLSSDLITIYGALNHMYPNAPVLGTVTDAPSKSSGTFIAQLKYLIESVLTIKPTANLVIIGTHNGADQYRPALYQPINGGKNIGDYVTGMGEVARYYGCPFIDMYGKCGFNASNLLIYTSDGVHPNALGYQRIASVITGELQRIEPI